MFNDPKPHRQTDWFRLLKPVYCSLCAANHPVGATFLRSTLESGDFAWGALTGTINGTYERVEK